MLIVKAAVAAGIIILVLDGLWLGLLARDWIMGQMGALRRETFVIPAAVAFYLLYAVGVAVFAVAPAMQEGGWVRAAMLGTFLGLVAYGTYDLTNLAVLKDWPVAMTVVDMIWGAVMTAAAAAGAVLILKAMGQS